MDPAQFAAQAITELNMGEVRFPKGESQSDLLLVTAEGREIKIAVGFRTLIASKDVPALSNRHPGRSGAGADCQSERIQMFVADRITAEARTLLRATGLSWLDLRGHMRFIAPGILVDSDLTSLPDERQERNDPLAGHAAKAIAVELLLQPTEGATVRELARRLNRSPSTVSVAISRMRAEHLVDAKSHPTDTQLFWRLAEHWKPVRLDIAALPPIGDREYAETLHMRVENVAGSVGWAQGDALAAVAYAAPVGVTATHPPDIYVPDLATLRRAGQMLGRSAVHAARAATLLVAPTAQVCSERVTHRGGAWPLVRPLFVALDLAQDPGRGKEILQAWSPPEPWSRVW